MGFLPPPRTQLKPGADGHPTSGRPRRRLPRLTAVAGLGVTGIALAALATPGQPLGRLAGGLVAQPALAQGTPSLLEFRWENNRDYRRLYYYLSNTQRLRRADYFLMLRPRDRNNAILKLTVTIPENFDSTIDTSRVRLCRMREGGMLARTRCEATIPATIELSANGRALEIFPDVPVPDTETIGVHMRLFNPFNVGMFQFNALAQAPGDVPVSGYLGSWLIQIDPSGG
ncbi:DUF2808 domain-containing protein [Cyanobium sp. CH-040]|uniref:DUF2808 domain-containing protein n=1 Tax=Cyanobium sp. CH-040 TaxID=2823708 RepID=UPI0028F44CBB|nr:DUF2808 domain-containing protein [Cyanobium sp. CH-040]MCP9926452.1 DUF2808 domain-containing protein [Cyanobium sp. CH-040]